MTIVTVVVVINVDDSCYCGRNLIQKCCFSVINIADITLFQRDHCDRGSHCECSRQLAVMIVIIADFRYNKLYVVIVAGCNRDSMILHF